MFQKRDAIIVAVFVVCFVLLGFSVTTPVFFIEENETIFSSASADTLESHVRYFSGLEPTRSYSNPVSLERAASYIEGVFREHCESVESQVFEVDGMQYRNLICSFNTSAPERIVVGAHYDAHGHTPGADDNASGVAGVLELARMVSENDRPSDRLDLVAYTLEEPPFYSTDNMGSYQHASVLADESAQVRLMLALEMIGYYSLEENTQSFPVPLLGWLYPTTGDFIALVGKTGSGGELRRIKRSMKEVSTTDVYSISAPAFIPGIDFSDHRNYWRHDFPALMVTDTAFYRNHNYHMHTDTPDTLNYETMADVVNGVYWAVLQY
jgi:hypothetical protein